MSAPLVWWAKELGELWQDYAQSTNEYAYRLRSGNTEEPLDFVKGLMASQLGIMQTQLRMYELGQKILFEQASGQRRHLVIASRDDVHVLKGIPYATVLERPVQSARPNNAQRLLDLTKDGSNLEIKLLVDPAELPEAVYPTDRKSVV